MPVEVQVGVRVRRLRAASADPAEPSLHDDGGIDAAYAAHGAELYRFALRGLGDVGAAQDVVQETFLRAWRSADRYDSEVASLRVWLFAIARNAMIDHARASAVRPWEANVQDVSATDAANGKVEDPIEHLMRSWMVQEALQRISGQHRTAIVETHLKERPYAEVAAEQGIPIGTLRSRVFYGLKSLRVALEEMGEIL